MSFYAQTRWGDSVDNPTEVRMREILAELDENDLEHPSACLSHESGWSLSLYETGLLIWENLEEDGDPRHIQDVSQEQTLKLWLLLADGDFNEIQKLPWKIGYGSPLSEVERAELQRKSAEMTLNSQREFYDRLGAEDRSKTCQHPDCDRGTVKFSALCRVHHFESIYKQACPFK